ncbi:bifunctional serine/threonine-protein kinase/formylglycine-generating enzyme family protein [Rhodopirellula sp.]|nr:bifunctional serine/threonine-protein kinase/formylglycine-generating enzyme family protein [Rhodopirellula sp.]
MAAASISPTETCEVTLSTNLDEDAIFRRALMIPVEKQRLAFLDDTCENDSALRARLDSLLEADTCDWNQFDTHFQEVSIDELPIRTIPQIENYLLREKIGEGGMAEVFFAEQLTPFRREVAVKIQRTNSFKSESFRRFRSEQQTLAKLKHENIATIYDGGVTSDGCPFVAMELVQGQPITTFCNDHRLSIRERLVVMRDVCNGIEFAHHNGVIHRDLKPANILITETISGPVPKIIDFGIAKDTEQVDEQNRTKDSQWLGTLNYMSPEQVRNEPAAVDAHSDIFALGVILHEMLVDEIPLAEEFRAAGNLEGILKCIRETVPVPISSTLRRLGSPAYIAEKRGTNFDALTKEFTPELDEIVSRMLAKQTEDRYSTIRQVSAELDRVIEGRTLEKKRQLRTERTRPQLRYYFILVCLILLLIKGFLPVAVFHSGGLFFNKQLSRQSSKDKDASDARSGISIAESPQLSPERNQNGEPPDNTDLVNVRLRSLNRTAKLTNRLFYLLNEGKAVEAFLLTNAWAADPQVRTVRQALVLDVNLSGFPENAKIEICDWNTEPFGWQNVSVKRGVAELPLREVLIKPFDKYIEPSIRMRVTCSGYLKSEMVLNASELEAMRGQMRLVQRNESTPDNMELVYGDFGAKSLAATDVVSETSFAADAFWMDRFEVSNQDYREFVLAGGYENAEFWSGLEFVLDGEKQSFDEAMKRFLDSTGKAGPASWVDGSFAVGMASYPVSGLSFFEASAYAQYRGKRLPTLSEWRRAASGATQSAVSARQNFENDHPAKCGAHTGISRFNIRDLGGNVREWCSTGRERSSCYILGGSWQSSSDVFALNIVKSRWNRSIVNGFRCCKNFSRTDQKHVADQNASDAVPPNNDPTSN